jgi:DNA repair ATPase RecN
VDLNSLKTTYQGLLNDLHVKMGKKQSIESQIGKLSQRVTDIDTETQIMTKASMFLQSLSDQTRQQIVDKISSIVTDALQKIKDPNLEFKMLLSTERNQTDLKFVVLDKQTGQEYDILNSYGGTIADIVTFPLRVSLLMKWEPSLSKILVMDENFKFVSVADQEALAEFVKQIADKLGLQIILVTHSPTIASKAHKLFQVTKAGSVSHIEGRAV